MPSNSYGFTQPIELRVQELVAGVRSDIGLSLYGDDLTVLKTLGDRIVRVLNGVQGSADVQAQQVAGLPYLRIQIKRNEMARYGINASDVLDVVGTIGGHTVGEVFEGQRRFPLQVRLAPQWRTDIETLGQLKIDDRLGRPIPIAQVAHLRLEDGPSEIVDMPSADAFSYSATCEAETFPDSFTMPSTRLKQKSFFLPAILSSGEDNSKISKRPRGGFLLQYRLLFF